MTKSRLLSTLAVILAAVPAVAAARSGAAATGFRWW